MGSVSLGEFLHANTDVVREHEVEKGLLFALKRRADRNLGSRRAFLSGNVVSAVSFHRNERQKTTGVAIRCGALRWDRPPRPGGPAGSKQRTRHRSTESASPPASTDRRWRRPARDTRARSPGRRGQSTTRG